MKYISLLLVILLLLVSCNDKTSDENEKEKSPSEPTVADVLPALSDAEITGEALRTAYETAERTYAIFTGFASPEMAGDSIEIDGNRYERVAEFADMEALRDYTAASFDEVLTESLLARNAAENAPLYIEHDGALYRFGGYRGLMSYDDVTITAFEFEETDEGDYRLTVDAQIEDSISGSCSYRFTLTEEGIRFCDFSLMCELLMSSLKLAAPAYTEAAMLALFTESCGKPLFTHKIFCSRIYLFPVIEGDTFAVYCAEDYADDTPVEFKRAIIRLPDEYRYDSATPLSITGGGGSGECLLFVRLTEKGVNRYLALDAESGSAYDDAGSFTGGLTFDFAYECSLADVIRMGYAPTEADLGAGLSFCISSSELNDLTSNLTSLVLAGCPFEISFDDLPNVKLTGRLDEKSGAPMATCLTVGAHALRFDEAPEPLTGDFTLDLFRAEGLTVFDKLRGHIGDSYLFTETGIIEFHEDRSESGLSVSFFARRMANAPDTDDPLALYDLGYELCYTLYANKYNDRFAQSEKKSTWVLEVATAADELCYETGRVTHDGGNLSFIPEATYTVGDLYDLDALFKRARRDGNFTEFEKLEDLLASHAKTDGNS